MIAGKLYAVADDRMFDTILADIGGHLPGIYRVHVKGEDGALARIPRLLDVDQTGTLYIGTGQSVPSRVASLRKSVMACYQQKFRDPGTHQVGKRLSSSPTLKVRYPLDRFYVSVEKFDPEADGAALDAWGHYGLEAEALALYRSEFGEHPPLNT